MQLKYTLCGIYLLLYLLKKKIRNVTTITNSSTAVTTPAVSSEFAEGGVEFTELDVEFEERDVKFMDGIAKITTMDRVINDATVDLRM